MAGTRAATSRTTRRSASCARVVNCRTTLLAGFTTVRNLGLFVKTGGYLLDVALGARRRQRLDRRAAHRAGGTRDHADGRPPRSRRCSSASLRTSCRSRVEEGIANGVPEVRKAVRYQIKYGARLIKISASGGVMSHSGLAGAQQYSDEEIAAIVDEAHRAGIKVAAHAHGDAGIRACIRAGVDCIEHGSLASRRDDPDDGRPRHVPRADELSLRRPRRLDTPRPSCRRRQPKCSRRRARCSARRSRPA